MDTRPHRETARRVHLWGTKSAAGRPAIAHRLRNRTTTASAHLEHCMPLCIYTRNRPRRSKRRNRVQIPGNVELPVILIAQFDAMPLAESGRAAAEIDCDIEDRSASHPNQLSLWMLPLIVQSAQCSAGRTGHVVLHPMRRQAAVVEPLLLIGFEEKAARIRKHARLDEHQSFEWCGVDMHFAIPVAAASASERFHSVPAVARLRSRLPHELYSAYRPTLLMRP